MWRVMGAAAMYFGYQPYGNITCNEPLFTLMATLSALRGSMSRSFVGKKRNGTKRRISLGPEVNRKRFQFQEKLKRAKITPGALSSQTDNINNNHKYF